MSAKTLKKKNTVDEATELAEQMEEEAVDEEVKEIFENGINLADDEQVEHEMLCGYTDKEGVHHTTYTLREMTGRDEEAISKPDVQNNQTKAINILLARTVQTIGTLSRKDFSASEWQNIIYHLYSGDQDVMLMELRRISISDKIKVQHVCPHCKAKLNTELTLGELEIRPFKGETVLPFTLSKGYKDRKGEVHKDGIMRLPNGLDREILTPLARKNLAKANTTLLTRLCKFNDGTHIDDDVMSSLTVKDREILNQLLSDNTFGYNLEVEVECDQCGEVFTGSLNSVNFLR